jgi:hypothetical protein
MGRISTGFMRLDKLTVGASVFCLSCALAALRPLMTKAISPAVETSAFGFPGWSVAPVPPGLAPLKLNPRDTQFARQFPGQIAAFTDGNSTWIVRWLAQPTRKLHPATDCLRATGYGVKPEPILAANGGTHWGVVTASRGNENLIIRERIIDAKGGEFTDVSAWFWAATFEKSSGPWWCVTRIESNSSR